MATTTQRFQGKCYASSEGRFYMNEYDNMPREVRDILKNSRFNICSACLSCDGRPLKLAIEIYEAAILVELGEFGPQPVNPEPLIAKSRRIHNGTRGTKSTADLLDMSQANPS